MKGSAPPRELRVAVVDDDPSILGLVRTALAKERVRVETFLGPDEFITNADPAAYDLILCDLVMPGLSGMELLRRVREKAPGAPFVMISGQGTVPTAVEAMRAGAADFLVKPFRVNELVDVVHKWALPEPVGAPVSRPFALGESPAWRSLLEKARRVGALSSTVLIRGETGSGKDVVAKYIASFGPRADMPFVSVNCAAIPDTLIESELFGHVKGAFTGATEPRRGLFEEANGGTLLLDEVGTMPLAAQAKILRALDEKQIRRVGDSRTIAVDVRILSATNLDIEASVAKQTFREDLYYRLAVVTLWVPALRERGDDVLLLADRFLEGLSAPDAPPRHLSTDARALVRAYPFPGNVRELKHALESAVALTDRTELLPEDLPFFARHAPAAAAEGADEVTPEKLREALARTRGNRVEAARQLGISRSTLYRMLRKLPPA